MPSIKFATLKFWIALALNEVCGGGPLGTPPPACCAVVWERRTGGGFAAVAGGCDEALAFGFAEGDEVAEGRTEDFAEGFADDVGEGEVGTVQQGATNRAMTSRTPELMSLMMSCTEFAGEGDTKDEFWRVQNSSRFQACIYNIAHTIRWRQQNQTTAPGGVSLTRTPFYTCTYPTWSGLFPFQIELILRSVLKSRCLE